MSVATRCRNYEMMHAFVFVIQVQQAPKGEELGGRTSSSSVDLLKAFVQQRNGKNKGSLSDAMDALGKRIKRVDQSEGDGQAESNPKPCICLNSLNFAFIARK